MISRKLGFLLIFSTLFCLNFGTSNATSSTINKKFKESTHILIDYIVKYEGKNKGYEWLEPLVDDFGHRHVGSDSLEKAIDFTVERLKKDGFDDVHTEDVPGLPHWVRGDDIVELIEPRNLKLNALAIGGCGQGDVTAEAIVLQDYDQLDTTNVSGKIVVFAEKWVGYGQTARYRKSAKIVAEHGAVGVLIRSVGPFSLSTPHTGSGASDTTIPSACLPLEEVELLERLFKRNKTLKIHIQIKSRNMEKVTSRNTIFDIRGSEWPHEIILLSGHMDSWDVGQGALDDGGGMAAVWQAMKSLMDLSKINDVYTPKRTIRGIFWTAEEQGLFGAQSYYNAHSNSSEKFYFVSETDQGAFKPTTYGSQLTFMGAEKHRKRMDEIVKLLNGYGIPLTVVPNKSQGDVQFWAAEGVPSTNYVSEKGIDYYFYFHHTQADYLTIFKDGDIDYTAAIFATLAHVIANMDSWD